ncbi:HAD family hydrolase [Streptomyces sp. Ru71]|uniref:HAD family hydrolase n=1 Tax=Streptomyces sp. Ru71 TaxID=2080746 RepID=UPI0021565F27|nr:HAD family hydrolase [Streptomyces sp. Ru71]
MTPDTTRTRAATDETRSLPELIARARVVLWDFDGPICRLFASHPAEKVADDMVRWLEGQGLHGLLTDGERESLDPHAVLRAVDRRHPRSDLVAELEERLTKEELHAASSAMPTPWADPLVRTWTAVGARMAITTNNSPRVVGTYLTGRGLLPCFTPHVYGRTQDLHLLKPHPHCLNRALIAMGCDPADALMIGDSPSDHHAAAQAGVPFLGYARAPRKAALLMSAGATHVTRSLEPLLRALQG